MFNAWRQPNLTAEIPYLRKMARLTTRGDASDADDLVQETLLKAMTSLESFRGEASLRTWLTTIMVNIHRSERRRAAHRDRYLASQPREEPAAPAQQEQRVEVAETLAALRDLPEDQRLAIAAVVGGEMSYAEASKALGVKLGTLMSRISRGRAALRRATEGIDTSVETHDAKSADSHAA